MSTSPSHRDAITAALYHEAQRKTLLATGQFKKVLASYSQQKQFLPDENTPDFWDKKFSDQNSVNSFPMERWRIKKVVTLLDCQKSILNLGVGRGALEQELLKKCATPNYVGTDITQKTFRKLRQLFPSLHFIQTDILSLSPKKRQFDQVLLLEVLEHIKPNETFSVLQHVFSLVKSGGRFIVSVPVNEGLENLLPENPNSHMRLYSLPLLRFELETVGFTVEKVYQASAFAQQFTLKQWLNSWLGFKEANNIVVVCKKGKG